MVRVSTVHNVGELIEVLQMFDKHTPVCLYDKDNEKANTLSLLHIENACSYDNHYKLIQADSLVLVPQILD